MAKWTSVISAITFHGPFLIRSAKSCKGDDFVWLTGWMRSRVLKNVTMNRIKQSTAQMVIVICQPCARSWPTANLATSGSVNPPTMNCAIFTAMKRKEFSRARSSKSAVMTPPSAEYGMLFIE